MSSLPNIFRKIGAAPRVTVDVNQSAIDDNESLVIR